MRTLSNRLSFAWLLLALITAPLQALAAPLSVDNAPHCAMHIDHPGDSDSHHGSGHCPACVDHACDNGNCTDQGCHAVHLYPSLPVAAMSGFRTAAGKLSQQIDHRFNSLTPAPLYRPPAA